MSLYVDASIVVALLAEEPTSDAVDSVLDASVSPVLLSDLALAESSAALATHVRLGRRTPSEAEALYAELDEWAARIGTRVPVTSFDIVEATAFVRLPGIALRTPDAIHIAAARRLGATILTLDKGMARAAATLGVPHINPAEAEAPGA